MASLNNFALCWSAYAQGNLDAEELDRDYRRFTAEFEQISRGFRYEVRFQRPSPLIEESLRALQKAEDAVFLFAEVVWKGSFSDLTEPMFERLNAQLNPLFACFDRLRQLQEQEGRLAESDITHDLLRCAALYQEEVLSGELWLERLQGAIAHFEQVALGVESAPVRLPAVEQMLDLLAVQQEALQSLAGHAQQGLPPRPEDLELLRQCSRQAKEIHEELLSLQGQQPLWCSSCQAYTPAQGCGPNCKAVEQPMALPDVVDLIAQGEEGYWDEFQTSLAESRASVAKTLAKAKSVKGSPVDFESALSRLDQVLGQLAAAESAAELRPLASSLREAVEAAEAVQHKTQEWLSQG
jgi:hypothetical protein